tara:strand:+ start:453 stop:617 length:165 start_codon:yes stop_codon:yes gene_type:complete
MYEDLPDEFTEAFIKELIRNIAGRDLIALCAYIAQQKVDASDEDRKILLDKILK